MPGISQEKDTFLDDTTCCSIILLDETRKDLLESKNKIAIGGIQFMVRRFSQ